MARAMGVQVPLRAPTVKLYELRFLEKVEVDEREPYFIQKDNPDSRYRSL